LSQTRLPIPLNTLRSLLIKYRDCCKMSVDKHYVYEDTTLDRKEYRITEG
jgi:hypothetical protein